MRSNEGTALALRPPGAAGTTPPKNLKIFSKILDKQILNCYSQINTDSIPGGESPPTANPSECKAPRYPAWGLLIFPANFPTFLYICRTSYIHH